MTLKDLGEEFKRLLTPRTGTIATKLRQVAATPLPQPVQRIVNQGPVGKFLQNSPQVMNRYVQNYATAATLGLVKPQLRPANAPQGRLEKIIGGIGTVGGFLNPVTSKVAGRVFGGLNTAGSLPTKVALQRFAPNATGFMASRVVPAIGGELAQTLGYAGLKRGSEKLGLSEKRPLNLKTLGQDFLLGLGTRGAVSGAPSLMRQFAGDKRFSIKYGDKVLKDLTPDEVKGWTKFLDFKNVKYKLEQTADVEGKQLPVMGIKGKPSVQGSLPKETQQLLNTARQKLQNFNETQVMDYAQKVAKVNKSKVIRPQDLAEALQYTMEQNKNVWSQVKPYNLFEGSEGRFKTFSGNEMYDRMRELGITDNLNPELPKVYQQVTTKINQLNPNSKSLLRTAIDRLLFTNKGYAEGLTVNELKQIDNVLNLAEKIKVVGKEKTITNAHIAEALQYRNLPEYIKGLKPNSPVFGRLKELGLQSSLPQLPVSGINSQTAKIGKVEPLNQKLPGSVEQATKGLQNRKQLLETPASQGVSASGGSIPPPSDPVQKIITALKEAKPLRGKQEAIYSKIRSQQAGAVAGVGKNIPGEKGFYAQLGQLKGEMPKVTFESIRKQIGQSDIDSLFNKVEQSTLSPFEKVTAKGGLSKLLGAEGGAVPQQGELKLLNEIFPPEFIQSVLDKKPFMQKLWGSAENLLNLPRAIMATADLSAPLRQGVFLVGRPKQWGPAFGNMFRYFKNENAYKGLQENIKSRPTYRLMRQGKLALTDMSPVLASREEAFMSNLAEKIPGFGKLAKASNRAYSGFLNKLRADTFDDLVRTAIKQGIKVEGKVLEDIAKFVNSATGRGDLGALTRSAPVLTNVFFSPRLMASRLNLLNPAFYVKLEPTIRKEALKSLFTFAGTALTVLGLAKLGGAEVGDDPRSADFAKIKTGDTRYDILGGFQQYMVLAARLISGQMVSSTTGREFNLGEGYKPTTRFDIIQRFFESKNSPVASFALGLLKGQTNMGEPFKPSVEVIDRLIPMVAQDMYDLYREDDANGIFKALPALFGVGVQTYGDQVPMQNITPTGKISTKWRMQPSLGETMLNKITGSKVSNIPVEKWPQLRAIKEAGTQKKLQQDVAKRMLLETGKTQEGGGQKFELKNGIVTPVGKEDQGFLERIFGIGKTGAAEETGLDPKLQKQLDIANAKLEVAESGEPKQIGDVIIYPDDTTSDGTRIKTVGEKSNIKIIRVGDERKFIDLNFQPKPPVLTGNKELDKKAKSKFQGEITSKANDIYDLYLSGEITAEEAETQLNQLKAKKKKLPTITFKKLSVPKVSAGIKLRIGAKLPNIKIKKAPFSSKRNLKLTSPKKIYSIV